MKGLIRYLRLYAMFMRNCLVRDLEFRGSFIAASITTVFWLFYYLVFIQIIYSHTDSVAGWSKGMSLILAGSFSVCWGLVNALIMINLSMLPEHIQKGTFDLILTKPVDSQFLASCRMVNLPEFARTFMAVAVIVYGVKIENLQITPLNLSVYLLLMICSMMILYGIDCLIMTLSFWLVRIRNLDAAFWSLSIMARWPADIYKGFLRNFVTFFIPLVFIATVPARGLADSMDGWMLPTAVGFAVGLSLASRLLWLKATRIYASAGG